MFGSGLVRGLLRPGALGDRSTLREHLDEIDRDLGREHVVDEVRGPGVVRVRCLERGQIDIRPHTNEDGKAAEECSRESSKRCEEAVPRSGQVHFLSHPRSL